MSDRDPRFLVNIERHFQTILITLTTGAIVFAATYVFNDRADKAVLNQQIKALTDQVIEARADIRAMRDAQVTREEFRDHEQRIRALERAKP